MPAYDNNTPLATQQINQTQNPILTNFASIQQLIDVNHVGFADPINFGKHFFIQMPESATKLTTSAAEIGLYVKDGVASLQAELYFQREGLGLDLGTPMTEHANNAGGSIGWTWLPSGLKIMWGFNITAGAGGLATITYNSTAGGGLNNFPGFTSFATPLVTPARTGTGAATTFLYIRDSYNAAGFEVRSSTVTAGAQFTWIAIGF